MEKHSTVFVLYHSNCLDGFGAAWAAYKKFGLRGIYIPVEPGRLPNQEIKDGEVYCLDVSFSSAIFSQLLNDNKKVVCIDHHATAQEIVESLPEHVFDINHSGAVLAWNYFFPETPAPQLLQHIEDTDIWKFALPHTKEIIAHMRLVPFDFKGWSAVAQQVEDESTRKVIVDKGGVILEYERQLVDDAVARAWEVTFKGYPSAVVNSSVLQSDIGHALVQKGYKIAIIWKESRGGMVRVSLRSEGDVDVSVIAQSFGGGGHKHAAGFAWSLDEPFPWYSR